MFQRRPRKFRRRSNGRGHLSHENGYMQGRLRSNSFSNIKTRNNFKQTQSAEKLFEKYNTLAKEAMSSGDKTLSENYLQHADHFMRMIDDKNRNQDETTKVENTNSPTQDQKILGNTDNIKQKE